MARKVDIEYVRYYSAGSEARQLELNPQRRNSPRPVRKPQAAKQQVIALDPIVVFGTLVAVCMLVMMVAGAVKLCAVQKQEQQMERYLMTLQQENEILEDTYHASFDLEQIREQALALGLVPMDQVQQISIQVTTPQPVQEQTGWFQGVVAFLTGIFA